MKKRRMLSVSLLVLAAAMMLALSLSAALTAPMTYRPGTTDTVTNMPGNNGLTGGEAYTVGSEIPQREGYEFLGWVLDHSPEHLKVTYEVKPDPVYGMPDDSVTPTDAAQYLPGDGVSVNDPLTSAQEKGINSETGESRMGTWTFKQWDRDDFEIYEDTTIIGEWKFKSKYKYTVHYLDIDTYQPLADDEVFWIAELGQVSTPAKIPNREFYTAYQNSNYNPVTDKVYRDKRGDFLLEGAVYEKSKDYRPVRYVITVTLTEDDQHIFFFYQRPSAG